MRRWRCERLADYEGLKARHRALLGRIRDYESLFVVENELLLGAHCAICGSPQILIVDNQYAIPGPDHDYINLRERLQCTRCGLNSRMRAAVELLLCEFDPRSNPQIYLTEQKTPLYSAFRKLFPGVVGSEYLGAEIQLGGVNAAGLRNEDLTYLSFGDDSFDCISTFDVLEHIPDYRAALLECWRCLRKGGKLILTAPFDLNAKNNVVRAKIEDGEIIHLLTPEYHGDPVSGGGILSFYNFGWELLEDIRCAGFSRASAHLVWSRRRGYMGGLQPIIIAVK